MAVEIGYSYLYVGNGYKLAILPTNIYLNWKSNAASKKVNFINQKDAISKYYKY